MARIRTIKPEFFTSEDIVCMSPLARLFYVSLWCESDREGRMEWKPVTFKMRYLPGDQCDIGTLAKELIDRGLLILYSVDGKQYAEIPTFSKHQVINNREQESCLPRRTDASSRVKGARARVQAEGKEGKEGKGKERAAFSAGFLRFWKSWPSNDRKQDKTHCFTKWELHGLEPIADLIVADVEAKKQSGKWVAGFVEMPMTYLNGRRWEDRMGEEGEGGEWSDTRKGVEGRAAELGLPAWDETEQFPIYKARILAAHAQGTH